MKKKLLTLRAIAGVATAAIAAVIPSKKSCTPGPDYPEYPTDCCPISCN